MQGKDYLLLFASNQIVKHLRVDITESFVKRKSDSPPASKPVLSATGSRPD
jgi:hypothetical protein